MSDRAPAFDLGHHAAEMFAWLWAGHHTDGFRRYIGMSYATVVPELPRFRSIVLSEADAGNGGHGWVQSNAAQWWVADEAGFRTVAHKSLPPWWGEHNAAV